MPDEESSTGAFRRVAAAAAACVLAAVVYLNLSDVLIREFGGPSLLQLSSVPLALILCLQRERRHPPLATLLLTMLLAGLAIFTFASSVYAASPEAADARAIEHAKMFAIYLTLAALQTRRGALLATVWTLLAAGGLLSALSLAQAMTHRFSQDFGGLARVKPARFDGIFEARIAGPLGDPNFFAQILIVLIPLALLMAWRARGPALRVVCFSLAFLLAGATALTYSRGGLIALAVTSILTLRAVQPGARQLAAGVVILLLGVILLMPAQLVRRLTTIEQLLPGDERVLHPDSSFEKRRLLTTTAWRMFLDHPLGGVGAGNYASRFDEYSAQVGYEAREYERAGARRYPHSLYLEMAAETGAPGLTLFGAIAFTAWLYVRRAGLRLRAAGDEVGATVAEGIAIAIVGYLVTSLFLHGHFLRYLWLLLAMAAALYRLSPETRLTASAEGYGESRRSALRARRRKLGPTTPPGPMTL